MRPDRVTHPSLGGDRGGQATIFAALVLFVLVCVLALTLDVGSLVHRRITLQNAADASALSGAAWEAKGLNLIASLNQGIATMFGIMTAYVVVAGISAYVMPALGSELIKCAPDVLITLYTIAGEMAKLEKKIAALTPYLTEAEALRIANANDPRVVALPYPFIPGDPHEDGSRLGLHVRKAKLKELVRKILDKALEVLPAPVTDALNTEPLKSFVKEPFYKSLEATAGSFDVGESGGMSFEETKVVVFERGKPDAGYAEFSSFLAGAREGKVAVTPGSETLVYARDTFTLDPGMCREVAAGSTEVTMTRTGGFPRRWGPLNPVTADLQGGGVPKEQDYVRKDVWTGEGRCFGKTYKAEEWGFIRFRAEVKKKRKISTDEVDTPPIPMAVDDDFTRNQWLAVLAWDTGRSRSAPLLKRAFPGANPWGALAVSQSRPRSPSTGDGEMLWETDWAPRLTPVTAQKALTARLRGGSRVDALTEKFLLH